MGKAKVESPVGDGAPVTIEQLQAEADEAKAQAAAAGKDAQRLQFIAESLSKEAEDKVSEAEAQARAAQAEVARMESEVAAANAETQKAKAALAEANAKTANDLAAVAREAAESALRTAEQLSDSIKPKGGPSVRLEGGGFLFVDAMTGTRDFRVLGLDGCYYEHVGQHPSGEWTYRNQDV